MNQHTRSVAGAQRCTLFTLLLLAIAAPPSRAAPTPGVELPPLTQPASDETHPGKVVWVDLVTPDLKQAEQFYGGLFKWSFEPVKGDPKFAVVSLDGRPIAGILQRPMKDRGKRQSAWLTFLAVRDVAAAQSAALAHGGKLLSAPRDYPQRGRQAVFSDPDGAVFAVLASSSGDPPDDLAQPGEWIWSSLLVNNPDQEASFYRDLFGYEVFDLSSEEEATPDGSKHVILASDDYARAGIHSLPRDSVHRHPHWLNFVRVEDAAAASAKAVALGGRVLVEPRVDRHGGLIAVVADPAGAPVGLMEWSDTDTQQVAP